MALLGGQHLNLLLNLRHAGALGVGGVLGLAQRFFQRGQLALLLFALGGEEFGFFFGVKHLLGQRFFFGQRVLAARGPLRRLFLELEQPQLNALAAFDNKADFRFQPPGFGAGFVELALRLIDLIARVVMRLADGFQTAFNVAQVDNAAFQIVHGFFGIGLDAGLFRFAVGAF